MEAAAGSFPSEPASRIPDEVPSLETVRAAFPQYEILEFIGAGGMGAVYKARQPKLDRFVALKILPQRLACHPRFAESFSREARVLARLNHPSIVTVHDFGESSGFFYLVMEYVDGANLRQAMAAGRFSPDSALAIVPRICEALQFAHEQGILHRDIKPENILLDARGRVKIADFGIAKLMGEKAGNATLTVEGAVVGTPSYMAPEQLERPRDVDNRADIYSLGVVFYEMLTGELPVGRFAPPSQKSAVDPRVDPIVLRSLEKERERRYQTVAEVKTQVEEVATAQRPGGEPRLAPRRATQDFILCNPRLPRLAQAITVYTLIVAPFFWLLGLGLPADKLPAEPYAALLQAATDAVVKAGDFVAVALLFLGGMRLRALRQSAPSILRITLWFHLCLLAVGIAGFITAEAFNPAPLDEEMTFAEHLHTTLGLGMVAFEVWALVWLRRNREGLGELCDRTVVQPPAHAAGARATGRPTLARGATMSLVFTLISLPLGFIYLLTMFFVIMVPANLDNWLRENALDMATAVGLLVVPACLGLLLGVWALQQIRTARGHLRGLARSLVGALAWPAIVCLVAVNSIMTAVMGGFPPGGWSFVFKFGGSALVALTVCVALVYLAWRWARNGSTAANGRGWLVVIVAAALLVCPTLLTGMFIGQAHTHRAALAARHSRQAAQAKAPPPSASTPDAAPPAPATPAPTTAK